MSSEFFANVRPRRLRQTLLKYVPEHAEKARIVAYVRPHHSRVLAAFIQSTKTGQPDIPIAKFLEKMKAGNGTLDDPINLDPETVFTPSELIELRRLAREIAKILLGCRRVYPLHFRVMRGLFSPDMSSKVKLADNQKTLNLLDARLNNFGDILRG